MIRALAWMVVGVLLACPVAYAEEEQDQEAPASRTTPTPRRPSDVVPLQDLPGVVVTGSVRAPGRLSLDRPSVVPQVSLTSIGSRDVFGPQRVRETGARDANDLVHNLPALSARPYNGGEAAAPSFSMRGLPDDGLTEYVHVLIDGVPASPLPYGWTAFSFLPITTERIYAMDLIRGGHTVRYSPNTVGGILNLITLPISDEPGAMVRGTFGSYGYRSLLATGSASHRGFGARVTVVGRRGDGYRDDGEFDQQEYHVKLRQRLGRRSWIAGAFTYMDSEHKAPGGLTLAQFDLDRYANGRPNNRFEGDRTVADVIWHNATGCDSYWEAFAYLSRTFRHLRAQRPHFGVPATISDWTDTSWFAGVGARVQQQLRIGGCRHTLYGGVRYQREWLPHYRLASEPYPGGAQTPTQDAKYETDTVSMHVDDTFHPMPRLTVQLGARVEWIPNTEGRDRLGGWAAFDDDFFRVLPGAGASYQLNRHAAVFANYFEGFRAPQVWGYAYTPGNGTLEFELGRTAEAGLRWKRWHGLDGSVTGWYTEYDDFGVFYTGFYENLGRIEAQGVDVVASWDVGCVLPGLRGLGIDGSLTVQKSELKEGANAGNETPYAWEEKATWRIRYQRCGWYAGIGGTYVGESYSDDANTTTPSADGTLGINPATTLWDARIAKSMRVLRRGTLELAVGATNLFDNDWFVHSRGGFFGGGLVAGPPFQGYASVQLTLDL